MEIGAGARAHDGYLAYDVNPEHADIVGDAQHLPFPDGSIEALRAVDVLEHLSWRVTDRTLAEWARVCSPGADLYVQVPAAHEIMRRFVAGDERLTRMEGRNCSVLEGATWRLLGGHADNRYVTNGDDWRWNAHHSLWSDDSLTEALSRAGFQMVRLEMNEHPNLLAWATRLS